MYLKLAGIGLVLFLMRRLYELLRLLLSYPCEGYD